MNNTHTTGGDTDSAPTVDNMTDVAFTGDREYLSNFARTPFTWRNRQWGDIETAFQAAKAVNDDDYQRIAAANGPGHAKKLGRRIQLRDDWEHVKHAIMAELLAAKFADGSDLAAKLCTEPGELVEHNTWGDRHWGRVNGRGENWLGRLLMARRATLQADSGLTVDTFVDMWDLWVSGAWVVVPTNTQTRRDGTAVMGGGVAKAAADRFAGIDTRYGASLQAGTTRVAYPSWRALCVPTKEHWKNPSTLELVDAACEGISTWCNAHPDQVVAVPALGAGLGGLNWADVHRICTEHLNAHRVVLMPPK